MNRTIHAVGIAGSIRDDSYNRTILKAARSELLDELVSLTKRSLSKSG